MKSFKGFTSMVIAVIVALLVGAGVTYAVISKKNQAKVETQTETTTTVSTNTSAPSQNQSCLTVTSPRKNTTVHFPLVVTGTIEWGCWGIFEANAGGVSVRQNGKMIGGGEGGLQLTGATPNSSYYDRNFYPASFSVRVISSGIVQAGAAELVFEEDDTCGDTPDCPPDRAPVIYPIVIGVPAGLPDYFSIAADGSLVDESDMSGHFPPAQFGSKTVTVKAYFPNHNLLAANPQDYGHSATDSCLAVYPVTRTIPETVGVGKAALEELFKGPTSTEVLAGYGTAWSVNMKVNSLAIQNGVAYLDLNKLDGAGGSCGINTMAAQIERTLKQFPTVTSVRITVNGYAPDWESLI